MRFAAALILLVLAPFTGELLLGNIPAEPSSWVTMLIPLALLYGGGALLIRETARRFRRGYPTMLVLAVAYGLIEEGFVVGTLFNPDYLGLGLLDHGWVPALGTSPVWAIYVVGIHAVWSILVPVVLTEHLFPARSRSPWLGIPGLMLATLIYLAGALVMAFGVSYEYGFFPSTPQLLAVTALVLAAVALAFSLRPVRPRPGSPPAPALLALCTFACGSAFIGTQMVTLPAALTVAVMLVVIIVAAVLVGRSARASGWSPRHRVAAASGAVATYCWVGFTIQLPMYGVTAPAVISQSVFVILAVLLMLGAHRGARRLGRAPGRGAEPVAGPGAAVAPR